MQLFSVWYDSILSKVILENPQACNLKIYRTCQYKAKQKGMVKISYSLGPATAVINL